MNFIIESEQELGDVIWMQLSARLKAGFRCALVGDLGAGKTTLVKRIAKKLKIKDHITSPTFNLRKEYIIDDNLFLQHIDLYRHESKVADNAEILEWVNDQSAITFVEWPERAFEDLSIFDLVVRINQIDKSKREVSLLWN